MRLSTVPRAAGATAAAPRSAYVASVPCTVGRRRTSVMVASERERWHVDPAPLAPALQRRLDQLHAFRAFGERPAIGRVPDDVADEMLPLDLEAVVVALDVGNLLPLLQEVHRLPDVGVPD